MSSPVEQQIRAMLADIDEVLLLASENLLKATRYYDTKHSVEDRLKVLAKELDERDQLVVEKVIPNLRAVPRSGVFMRASEVNGISPLREVLFQLLAKHGQPQAVAKPKDEVIIHAGKPYDGRKYLRSILSQAKTAIFIRDNFLKPEILDVLSEFALDNPKLKIRLLVRESQHLESLRASSASFEKQYPGILEIRYHIRENGDHPRYILLDEDKLFTPDNSLDAWGKTTTNIHEHKDKSEISDLKKKLEEDWRKGTELK